MTLAWGVLLYPWHIALIEFGLVFDSCVWSLVSHVLHVVSALACSVHVAPHHVRSDIQLVCDCLDWDRVFQQIACVFALDLSTHAATDAPPWLSGGALKTAGALHPTEHIAEDDQPLLFENGT
eukprot:5412650-Amphidinium_carterae.1